MWFTPHGLTPTADSLGGALYNLKDGSGYRSDVSLTNSRLWGNEAPNDPQLHNVPGGGIVSFSYSLVEGQTPPGSTNLNCSLAVSGQVAKRVPDAGHHLIGLADTRKRLLKVYCDAGGDGCITIGSSLAHLGYCPGFHSAC